MHRSVMHLKQLEQRILKAMGEANRDFSLIQGGDRILVALSGGKDSYAMMWGLMELQKASPEKFELVAYHLDQGQPGHDTKPIEGFMQSTGLPYEVEYQDTYSRVVEKTEPGKIYCSLCSRFRRAILYKAAIRHNCNKIALGHHRDDLIETLLLSMLYSGQIKSMPAKLLSDAKTHEIIRPLCYAPEEYMAELAVQKNFPVVPCRLCGSQEKERQFVKKLLKQLSEHSPHIKGNLLTALSHVVPSHLLDKNLKAAALSQAQFEQELSLGDTSIETGCASSSLIAAPKVKATQEIHPA